MSWRLFIYCVRLLDCFSQKTKHPPAMDREENALVDAMDCLTDGPGLLLARPRDATRLTAASPTWLAGWHYGAPSPRSAAPGMRWRRTTTAITEPTGRLVCMEPRTTDGRENWPRQGESLPAASQRCGPRSHTRMHCFTCPASLAAGLHYASSPTNAPPGSLARVRALGAPGEPRRGETRVAAARSLAASWPTTSSAKAALGHPSTCIVCWLFGARIAPETHLRRRRSLGTVVEAASLWRW
jgi:hypothetical protein